MVVNTGDAWAIEPATKLINQGMVFDDFIAAAEYLLESRLHPTKCKLAHSQGGSTAAVWLAGRDVTKKSALELFAVACQLVGLLDSVSVYHTPSAPCRCACE